MVGTQSPLSRLQLIYVFVSVLHYNFTIEIILMRLGKFFRKTFYERERNFEVSRGNLGSVQGLVSQRLAGMIALDGFDPIKQSF